MEVGNLPVFSRARQLLLEPCRLRRRQVVGFEREKAHAGPWRLERVVGLAVHVEEGVARLAAVVVVAERGVELDALREEGFVRLLELLLHVLRPLAAVDVVADGDHELEGKSLLHLGHLLAELILVPIAGTKIAEHREFERAFTIGQRDRRLRRLAGFDPGRSGQSRGEAEQRNGEQCGRKSARSPHGEPGLLRDRACHVVDDDVRVHVEEDERRLDEAVLEFFGQLRQRPQDLRRDAG